MLLRLLFEKGKSVAYEIEYIEQNSATVGVRLVDEAQKGILEKKICELNDVIADDAKLEKAFVEYLSTWNPLINTWIQPYKGKFLPGLHKRGLLPSLIGSDKKLLLANLVRCESHRDVLLSSISER